jgi:hypothetical protein
MSSPAANRHSRADQNRLLNRGPVHLREPPISTCGTRQGSRSCVRAQPMMSIATDR